MRSRRTYRNRLHAANGEPGRAAAVCDDSDAKSRSSERVAEGVLWLLSPAASLHDGGDLEMGGGR